MLAVLLISLLVASVSALPPFPATENNDPMVCILDEINVTISQNNILNYPNYEEYNLLRIGKRLPGDESLDSGSEILLMKQNNNTLTINPYKYLKVAFSFIELNYTSVDQKNSNCSLKHIGGGPGHNYTQVEYFTNSSAIFIQWKIYGFVLKNYDTKGIIHDVESKDDLEIKLREAGDKLAVLFFSAEWCGHSAKVKPEIEKLAYENLDVVFLKIDIDRCVSVRKMYNIRAVPAFVFIKSYKEVSNRIEGSSSSAIEKIRKTIEQHRDN